MDQIAANAHKGETQLSSLQLTADDNSLVGSCDVGYSCAYSSTLSWLTPTLPLMAENNPRVVFERLFGSSDSTDPRVRASRLHQDRSILDSVTARVKQLQQKLGPAQFSLGGTNRQYPGRGQVDRSFPTLSMTTSPLSLGKSKKVRELKSPSVSPGRPPPPSANSTSGIRSSRAN